MRRIMLLVAAATAIVMVETLSIGVASAQQASPASPTPSCSNTPPAQTVEHTQPSAKECGQAAISVSPISLDFGSAKVGTDSSPQYATLTNTGDVPVNILVSYSEDNPPYTVTGDNCENLQPQQSCQIKAIFHARKIDPMTVIVTLIGHPVNESLPDSKPQIVSLTGVGV